MPDVSGGQQGGSGGRVGGHVKPPHPHHAKAPDILRIGFVLPCSDRDLYMETGEVLEEDGVRVS